eukprot:Skav221259  [mRNA]  locus=scaffold174:54284:56171:- [translate_table: standard]
MEGALKFCCLASILGQISGNAGCEDEECMSFMQVKLEKHLDNDRQHQAVPPGVCLQSMSWEMYRQPIQQVVQQHPHFDGWCTYGLLSSAYSACAVARQHRSFSHYTEHLVALEDKDTLDDLCLGIPPRGKAVVEFVASQLAKQLLSTELTFTIYPT